MNSLLFNLFQKRVRPARTGRVTLSATRRRPSPGRIDTLESLESRFLLSTYFVSASGGSDAYGGTSDALAFKTLQKAANVVKPGDTVRVRAGTYSSGLNLFRHAGGTAAAPISFLADSGAVITHSGTSGTNAGLAGINIESTGGFFVIDGFTVRSDGSMTKAGIRSALSTNVVIRNCEVYGAPTGIFASRSDNIVVEKNISHDNTGEHGIYVNGSRNYVIRGNTTYGNNWNGIHTNVMDGVNQINSGGVIEGNVVRGNKLAGMDLTGMSDGVVRNNLVYGNGRHAVVLQNSNQNATVASHDVTFVNNTFDARAGSSAYAIQLSAAATQPSGSGWTGNDNNVTIFNNILIGNSSAGNGSIGNLAGTVSSSFRSDYNVVVDSFRTGGTSRSLAGWRSATGEDVNSVLSSATALFVDVSAANYRLKAGSPAADEGVGSFNGESAPAADAQGEARPQGAGYDVGYDELADSGPAPDTTPPAARLSASTVTAAGGTSHTFTVTYTDAAAVQVASLDGSDVRVTGPNGFNQLAALASVDSTTDGTPRTATYRVTAPGGTWDSADNGTYTVALQSGQVRDAAGNYAPPATLGTFGVSVPAPDTTAPTVTDRSPAAGAGGVSAATNVTATFSEPVVASGVTFELRDAAGALVPASVAYNSTSRTITLNPASDLMPDTTYTATLGGAKDAAGNAAEATSWSFSTAPAPVGGEGSDDFSGTSLGAAWTTSPYVASGSAVVADGAVSISGVQVRSSATVTRGVEARVRFTSRWQAFGIATDLTNSAGNYWAIIGTKSTPDQLYARTNVNGTTRTVDLGATPAGLHTYRVEAVAGGYAFYIDGVKVTTIAQALPSTAATRAVMSDMVAVSPLVIDWIRSDTESTETGSGAAAAAASVIAAADEEGPTDPSAPAVSLLA